MNTNTTDQNNKLFYSTLVKYSFVVDNNNNKLSPTPINNAYYLIRKGKAIMIDKYPMTIKLLKVIDKQNIDKSQIICGIDDGSKYVGLSLIQKCQTKTKVIFKSTIELRQDVKHLMDVRGEYRKYRRKHKRYRPKRFDNRKSSKRLGRIPPSIKQKKDSILRVINRLLKYINIHKYILEDVLIDIRKLTENKQLQGNEYQKSNRLDENLRIATLLRDNYTCQECGKSNCILEIHHITPRRFKGMDSIYNLITLCSNCHHKIAGCELQYTDKYYSIIKGKNIRLDYAQHVMQGKTYLRSELSKLGELELTTGGDTSNKRKLWNIEKSHSNDALVICNEVITQEQCNIKYWHIKPLRRKSKALIESFNGFKHRDLVKYTKKDGQTYIGYITSIDTMKKTVNLTTIDGRILKRYSISRCKLINRPNKLIFGDKV